MENMYLPGVPELHVKNFQMSHMIRLKLPKLFNHLKKIRMTTDYFTSKWIMTVFANSLPFDAIPFIFDNLLQDGWTSVYRIGISILKSLESILLDMDMFEITNYLRESVRNDKLNIHKILTEAERITILKEDSEHFKSKFLKKILIFTSAMFIMEQAKLKLNMKDEVMGKEQKDALVWAQEILEKTEPLVKQDILKFKSKIEEVVKESQSQEKIMLA